MISRATPSFWRAYDKLKQSDRDSARRVFRLFSENPAHNSLQFKKLRGHANLWSVRVGGGGGGTKKVDVNVKAPAVPSKSP
ncbi:MAG: hypothetical protein DMF02_07890 [Verrucomicrobia bacterium]|nr:MAG: hypothetical protein DMF02_07890 [Verrucomicrobiota bacterium]